MKLKRFLTTALSALMALSVCAMPAMADYQANPSSINTAQKGSITIHKYIYNGTASEDGREGTGSAGDKDKVPNKDGDKATPLPNVTFTYYKVMDATKLVQYYDALESGGNPVTIETYMKDGTWEYNGTLSGTEVKTEADGTVTISGLDVGLYAFFETDAPAGVTEPTKPFLVSLPMTDQQTGKDWIYNVEVFPKNKTAEAGITLQKQGVTGNEIPVTEMSGYTFALKKYDSKNKNWIDITKNAKDGADNAGAAIGVEDVMKTDANGQIKITSLTPGIYSFIETAGPDNSNYIIDLGTQYLFKVTQESKIVELTEAEKTTIGVTTGKYVDAVNGNTITVSNYKPELEKKIGQDADNSKNTEAADYSVGDMVPYSITVKIPKNITALNKFEVTDTPTNLEDDVSTIQYYNCDASGNNRGDAITNADTFANAVKDNNGFKITFTCAKMDAYAGQTIRIEYKAKLLAPEKKEGTGDIENPNKATLTYSNKVNSEKEEDKNSEKTITDETVVYTFKIKIVKKDDHNEPLTGVKFDLYKADTAGTVTDDEAGKLGLDSSKKWTKVNTAAIVTGNKGEISYGGLAQGDYYLVETETLKGYNLLSKPVKVELSKTYTASWEQKTNYDGDGNVTHHEHTSGYVTKFDDNNTDEAKTSFVTTTIVNRKGFTLPVTGGFGTLLFSGIGVLLVLAGVGVLFSLKKKNNRA